jgi:hypothetical protein
MRTTGHLNNAPIFFRKLASKAKTPHKTHLGSRSNMALAAVFD